jgi:hypothetical protein
LSKAAQAEHRRLSTQSSKEHLPRTSEDTAAATKPTTVASPSIKVSIELSSVEPF